MADPTIDNDAGTITLNMDDGDSNYTLSKAKMANVLDESTAMILIPQNYQKYDDFEDTDFTNWFYDDMGFTRTTDDSYIDNYNAKAPAGSSGDIQLMRPVFGTPPPEQKIFVCFVRFDSTFMNSTTKLFFAGHFLNKKPLDSYGIYGVGVNGASAAPNKWVVEYDAGSTIVDTGVTIDTEWHKLIFYTSLAQTTERTFIARKTYIDGDNVHSETFSFGADADITNATNANPCVITVDNTSPLQSDPFWQTGDEIVISGVGGMTELNGNTYTVTRLTATTYELQGIDSTSYGTYTSGGLAEPSGGFATDWRTLGYGQYDSTGKNIYMDEFLVSKDTSVYEEGTAQIDCQPDAVESFDSVTIDDNTTGIWTGSITYEFQLSTDGGSSFGNLQTLNNENLKGLSLSKDGRDVLRIKITQTPDSTIEFKTSIPRTNQISINFTPRISRLPTMGAG